jgi:hypothetical protein
MAICPTCLEYADPDDPATVCTVGADFHDACLDAVRGRNPSVRARVVLRPRDEPLPGPREPREPKGHPVPRGPIARVARNLDHRRHGKHEAG